MNRNPLRRPRPLHRPQPSAALYPRLALLAAILLTPAIAAHASPPGAHPAPSRTPSNWKQKVPARDRDRANPIADTPDAPAAGAHLFARNCASCHGAQAQGHGSRPSLRTPRVHDATDGELFWLLTNGELGHGMPSWARLPEPQRWQIVRFLHTLPLDEAADAPAPTASPGH